MLLEESNIAELPDYPPKFFIHTKATGSPAESLTPQLVVEGLDKEYSFDIIFTTGENMGGGGGGGGNNIISDIISVDCSGFSPTPSQPPTLSQVRLQ